MKPRVKSSDKPTSQTIDSFYSCCIHTVQSKQTLKLSSTLIFFNTYFVKLASTSDYSHNTAAQFELRELLFFLGCPHTDP